MVQYFSSDLRGRHEKDDPFQPGRTWRKANPSLRYHARPDGRDTERGGACTKRDSTLAICIQGPAVEPGEPRMSTESFVFDPAKWEKLEGDVPMVGSPVFGADLGSNASQIRNR